MDHTYRHLMTRREWMRLAGGVAMVAGGVNRYPAPALRAQGTAPPGSAKPVFCLFSKHLPELGWSDVGRAVKDAGFDGVDLTVRTKGHVLPERAADDLPRALDAIRAHGLSVPMITTELTSAKGPSAEPILRTAAKHGVRYFKTGYWHYRSPDVRGQIASFGQDLAGLAALARNCGIEMGFHNHAGYVGAALWDVAPAMDRLDARWAGYYFDPRHAVADGGGGAWKAATHLVAPRLKMVALKDCFWEKAGGGWQTRNCPLGEGMVEWPWVAARLREAEFAGPVSIHLEYDIPASTPGESTKRTLEAAVRDLSFARKLLA